MGRGRKRGVYTELFCRWVGSTGQVVAFEPNPQALNEIQRRVPGCGWLTLKGVALGSVEGSFPFIVQNGYSRNAHLQFEDRIDLSRHSVVDVQVSTGDAICARAGYVPNVIKIDVEGFEDEVLLGLKSTLASPQIRAILMEIHFQALANRGRPAAPIQIEKLLRDSGFRLTWVDMNHLQAVHKPHG